MEVIIATKGCTFHHETTTMVRLREGEGLVTQLDTLQDVICIVNRKGIITYVNEAVLPVWGYHTQEMIGRNLLEFVDEKNEGNFPEANSWVDLEFDELSFLINRIRTKDGSISELDWHHSWDVNKEMLFGLAKKPVKKKGVPVSGKKQIQDTLGKSYASIPDVLERITDGFYCVDADFVVTYWNNQSEHLTGVSKEAILGENLWILFEKGIGSDIYQHHQQAMVERVSQEYESYYEPLAMWFRVNTFPSADGLSVFFKDVTQQKITEEEVRKLSLIVRKTDNAVVLTDASNCITWVNAAFTTLTGYTVDEVAGKLRCNFLLGPKTDQKVVRYIDGQLDLQQGFQVEMLCYRKTGTTYWSHLICQPMFEEENKLQGYFTIQTDITEKKAHQKQITWATIKGQEKERVLLGQELHDNVNQVLTTVKLYLELCLEAPPNMAEILSRSSSLLLESINDIRKLSKRLSDPTIVKMKLKESIQDLIDDIAFTNKLHFTLETADTIKINKELHLAIYRVLQEHLTNILKHAEARHVQISVVTIDKEIHVTVKEDGKGFNVYQKRKGIGITNMRSRVESLNGHLTIESSFGKGSMLFANFPLH